MVASKDNGRIVPVHPNNQKVYPLESTSIQKNFLASIITTVFIGLINVFYPILIGLLFSSKQIGILALILSWTQLLSIPISNGIAPASLHFIAARGKEVRSSVQSSSFFLSFLCIIFVAFILPITIHQEFQLSFIDLMLIVINTTVSSFHVLFRMMLQGKELFQKVAIYEGISLGISILGFSFIYITNSFNPIITSSIFLLIPILINHFSFLLFSLKKLGIPILKLRVINSKTIWEIMRFAFYVSSGSIASLGLANLQIILAERLSDFTTFGIFCFWSYLTLPFEIIAIALGNLLLARMSNLSKMGKDNEVHLTASLNEVFSEIIIPLSMLLIYLIYYFSFIFDFLTLNKYQASTYWPIILMFFLKALVSIMIIPSTSYIAASKVKYNVVIALLMFTTTTATWMIFLKELNLFVLPFGLFNGIFSAMLFQQIVLSYYNGRWSGIKIRVVIILLFSLGISLVIAKIFNPIIGFICLFLITTMFFVSGIIKVREIVLEKRFLIIS